MNNPEFLEQVEKICKIIGYNFGVSDDRGVVLCGGVAELGEGNKITLPEEEPEGEIIKIGNRAFLPYVADDEEKYWFFVSVGESDEAAEKMLRMALYFFENRSESQQKEKSEFFRSLLTLGCTSVKPEEFAKYAGVFDDNAGEYTVGLVAFSRDHKSRLDDGAMQNMRECLKMVFPQQDGCQIVGMTAEKVAVICQIREENSYEAVYEKMCSVKDTVSAELLLNVDVALGSRVKNIKNIDIAYKTAERAKEVGIIFGFSDKCYSHEKQGAERLVYGLPKDVCQAYLLETFGEKALANDKLWGEGEEHNDEIRYTIERYLEMNQNIGATSKVLYVHRNTLNYRLTNFNKITGLDCTQFEDGMKIKLGLLIMKYLKYISKQA